MVLQFNIGFASTLYDALPELIRRFRITVPGVEVQLLELTTMEQVAALKDGRIDVGFGRLKFDDDTIVRKVIREEKLCLVTPVGHPLAESGGKVRLRDTAGEYVEILPQEAGMHLTVRLTEGLARSTSDVAIAERARERGLVLMPLSQQYAGEAAEQGFFLGYAGWDEQQLVAAANTFVELLRE
jgi:DNA-binding transcriptional LysR family regulator